MTGFYAKAAATQGRRHRWPHGLLVIISAFLDFSKSHGTSFDTSPAIGSQACNPVTVGACVHPTGRRHRGSRPTRGLACHSRGRSCSLLTRRSQTLSSGPVVTARNPAELAYYDVCLIDQSSAGSRLCSFYRVRGKRMGTDPSSIPTSHVMEYRECQILKGHCQTSDNPSYRRY